MLAIVGHRSARLIARSLLIKLGPPRNHGKVHAKVQWAESIAAGGCRRRWRNHFAVRVRCHAAPAPARLERAGVAGDSGNVDSDIESLCRAGHEWRCDGPN